MTNKITLHGKTYLAHDCLVRGDYGGAGSVGVANIRVVLKQFEERTEEWSHTALSDESDGYPSQDYGSAHRIPEEPCLHVTGDHGYEAIYFLEGEEADEILASLERYPLLDEEVHSEAELEWEREAWDSWVRADLIDALSDESLREWAGGIDDERNDILRHAYQEAMEDTNTYPEAEYDGVYVDVDRIAEAFEQQLRQLKAEDEAKAAGQLEIRFEESLK